MPLMNDRWRIPFPEPFRRRPTESRLFPVKLADLRKRIHMSAYQPFLQAVEKHALLENKPSADNPALSESARADDARSMAFLAMVRQDSRLAKSARGQVLAAGIGKWPAWVGMAQTVHDYLLAADLLRVAGYFDEADESLLRDRLAPKLMEGLIAAQDLPQNNWRVEADCSVAAAAMYFWHNPGTLNLRELLASSLDGLSRMLHGLIAPDGAYVEGINYSRRAAIPVIRLGWQYRQVTGMDWLNHPLLRRWWQWQVDLKRPDGRVFPIDDSNADYEGFPHPMLVHKSIIDAPLHRWACDRGITLWSDWCVEAMLVFDHRITPDRPKVPLCKVRSESGTALFRSGWGKDATMGILVARPFWPFGSDQINTAHRHDDQANFLLHGHGKLLVTEGGYGQGYGDPERYSYLLSGMAHNMVLVDGQGPLRRTSHNGDALSSNTSQASGRVKELVRRTGFYGAQAITSYQDADLSRSVFFIRNRWFVIIDQVTAARTRRFDWIMHGNSLDCQMCHNDGCVWTMDDTKLWLFNLIPNGISYRNERGRCQPRKKPGVPEDGLHTYHRVWTAGTEATFLTVLIPQSSKHQQPKVQLLGTDPITVTVCSHGQNREERFVWKLG